MRGEHHLVMQPQVAPTQAGGDGKSLGEAPCDEDRHTTVLPSVSADGVTPLTLPTHALTGEYTLRRVRV